MISLEEQDVVHEMAVPILGTRSPRLRTQVHKVFAGWMADLAVGNTNVHLNVLSSKKCALPAKSVVCSQFLGIPRTHHSCIGKEAPIIT